MLDVDDFEDVDDDDVDDEDDGDEDDEDDEEDDEDTLRRSKCFAKHLQSDFSYKTAAKVILTYK